MDAKKQLGARIKELRKIRKLTQEQLAEMVDVDSKHLSRIEVGGSYPSIDTLVKMSAALKYEVMDFFDYDHRVPDKKQLMESIVRLLREAQQEQLRIILRIIRVVVR
jgi:transcriptional regulator with XRE-family HTH domain